jgi:type VI secretion system protein ImpE
MSAATESYKAGRLQEAIDAQIKEVKVSPADQGKRLFLFELLAFAGDLDRAQRQIDAVSYSEVELDAAVLTYRKLLDSERLRRRLFSEGLTPKFFADPPAYVQMRLDGISRLREGRAGEAADLFAKAAETSPPRSGTLNDKPITSLRDCDDVFGDVLEVMAHGAYYWVPLEQVEAITIHAPKAPRDLLWAPARLEMHEAAGNVHLPAVYPGSHEHVDELVKLGRVTDWKSTGGGPVLGVGLRTFLVDDEAISLLEWRTLKLGT